MIIATAGHVDHGKTTLLHALTGVNADRLPEEKKRGMTIDLGYAYWPQPDGRIIGFIDVPGHEKFLSNMLAGVGGIDHALLIVACDDGVMAQTREHLTLLQLTSQPTVTVVLTKADKVSAERIEEVRAEVSTLLEGQEIAPVFVTAATTGSGIPELRQHIQQLSEQPHPCSHRFRLAIDRAFTVKGAGLVVTGTALSGEVSVGDSLWLTGANQPMRVRGLHAQNQQTPYARAGQRIALNISGNAEKTDITRGDWLLSEPPRQATERVIVELHSLIPLSQWQPLHIHHAARHITGRVSLLEGTLAELVLDTPLWLAENDRLVLRDISARTTLGGARALLLHAPRRGKRQPAFLHWLTTLATAKTDEQVLNAQLTRSAVILDDFAWARQLTASGLQQITSRPGYFQAGNQLLSQEMANCWQQKLLDTLARYHQQHDDQPGPGRERLRRMALPSEDEGLVLALIEQLRTTGQVINHQGWLHLPDYEPQFSAEQQVLWNKVCLLLGEEAWWVRDLAKATGSDDNTMRQLLRFAAQQGEVTAFVKDRYYRHDQIKKFASLIRKRDQDQGATSAADFRDSLGVGRKLAIQILEYFDREGFTRRLGNKHVLRDSSLF
ncbi:selenocysteine-specific translation elongation factor [uncultured Cedecea sp.]|uniref:selenocysteine-specific translation elongation factor n=1 Tax=uncultured Cedecea sp. TaxID=988762 RepID=UPI002616E975|nr:selenocysteine-specific translation elongation factor [uncultured Cedecea sp.]